MLLVACSVQSDTGSPDPVPDPTAEADPEAGESDIKPGDELTVYSGRSEELVGPIIEQFEQDSGIAVGVRYGDTAEMAATILEEGSNSPADVFYAQDAGALGALAEAGALAQLPATLLAQVEPRFRSPQGVWIGLSGRARVVAYNKADVDPADLPDSIFGHGPSVAGTYWLGSHQRLVQAFVTAICC
jgi:iron(III) transport system substrate-binding protein